MDRARSWLERNKVFFDTLAATLVALMAVTVAISQYFLASQQTEYSRVSLLPSFSISARPLKSAPNGTTYSDDKIFVENIGRPVTGFRSSTIVFLDLRILGWKTAIDTTFSFALNGYYSGSYYSGSGTGRLVTIEGYRNHEKFYRLEREIDKLTDSNEFYVELSVRRFLRLRYRDQLSAQHTSYYYVPLIHGASLFDSYDGEELFDRHRELLGSDMWQDIDRVKASELLGLIRGKLANRI